MTIRDLNRHRDWNIPDEEQYSAGLVITKHNQYLLKNKFLFLTDLDMKY